MTRKIKQYTENARAMPFRFPLATVLRIRESLEMREERALKKIQLEMARVAHQIEELSAAIGQANVTREQAMRQPIAAGHLQMYLMQVQAATGRKKALIADLQALEQQRLKQLKIYQAAHRDRETLTGMSQKQRDVYEYEQAQAHQKTIDDIFVARRQRG